MTDTARIRVETMRHLADHFDKLRLVGGSPDLDRALWHAASFMREQATWVEQGKVNIFESLDPSVPDPLVLDDLPGMWEAADFMGGRTDA